MMLRERVIKFVFQFLQKENKEKRVRIENLVKTLASGGLYWRIREDYRSLFRWKWIWYC